MQHCSILTGLWSTHGRKGISCRMGGSHEQSDWNYKTLTWIRTLGCTPFTFDSHNYNGESKDQWLQQLGRPVIQLQRLSHGCCSIILESTCSTQQFFVDWLFKTLNKVNYITTLLGPLDHLQHCPAECRKMQRNAASYLHLLLKSIKLHFINMLVCISLLLWEETTKRI